MIFLPLAHCKAESNRVDETMIKFFYNSVCRKYNIALLSSKMSTAVSGKRLLLDVRGENILGLTKIIVDKNRINHFQQH